MKKHILNIKNIFFFSLFLFVIFLLWKIITPKYEVVRSDLNFLFIEDLKNIEDEENSSLFLSMFPLTTFNEEDFNHYRALPTTKTSYCFRNLIDLDYFLKSRVIEDSSLTNVYFGIDPYKIAEYYEFDEYKYMDAVDRSIVNWVSYNSGTSFQILLPFNSLKNWCSYSDEYVEKIIEAYRNIVILLDEQPNITIDFLGNEEWLIANPKNYIKYNQCGEDISNKILAFTFRDNKYEITSENIDEKLEELQILINKEKQKQEVIDLSNVSVVFLGDSIIGNYSGSLSIPGVVSGLSNASVYNCGVGGASASLRDKEVLSFPDYVDMLINNKMTFENSAMEQSISDFNKNKYEKLCFIINYGLNDYFDGQKVSSSDPYDIKTYSGALRVGISKLKENYPEAEIILMTPSFCVYFDSGAEKMGEKGGILTDYVDTVVSLSEEMSVHYINSYLDLGVNFDNFKEYLDDGCHFNEKGRFMMGKLMVQKLVEIQEKK